MATGYITPERAVNQKTSQQAFVYHNGRWAFQCNNDIYVEMPVATFGDQEGWGDGSTQNSIKEGATGWNLKVNEMGYDFTGNIWQVFSRSSAGGGIRYHTTPYTVGIDDYGSTATTRLDNGGDNWNSSGFDAGKCGFITDQQGNPLFLALGSSSDGGTLSPKDGLLVGYGPLDVGQPHAQIESGFNRGDNTNVDPFLFNDGTDDYVGVVYSDGTDFKLAYHTTEATVANYATGWIVENIGVPAGDGVDDHVCARAFDGSLYAVVKGAAAASGYLITTTGGIDTATNNTTFLFTEFQDNMSRPVICLDESAEEMHIVYEQGGSQSTINIKSQPLSGFSFTPSDVGTVFMENGSDDMQNPTPPIHNVTSDMEFIPFVCDNATGVTSWHNRVDISAASVISVTEELKNINYTSLSPVISLTGVVSITETLVNTNYTALNPVIDLTGVVSITETLVNTSYTSLNSTITLTPEAVIVINEQLVNTNYISLNPSISLTGVIAITESLVNANYNALNPIITITAVPIQITEQTVNAQYKSINPSILLTPEPIGIVSTVCFDGVLVELIYNGLQNSLEYDGKSISIEFNGDFNELQFNGTIQTSCNPGSIKTNC